MLYKKGGQVWYRKDLGWPDHSPVGPKWVENTKHYFSSLKCTHRDHLEILLKSRYRFSRTEVMYFPKFPEDADAAVCTSKQGTMGHSEVVTGERSAGQIP